MMNTDVSKKKTIFVLEDDPSFSIIFKRWLEEAGYAVIIAATIEDAKKIIAEKKEVSLFWIDYYLGDGRGTGIDFFHWLKSDEQLKKIPAIMVSVTIDAEKLADFEKQGIAKAFSKNLTNRETLLESIQKILE